MFVKWSGIDARPLQYCARLSSARRRGAASTMQMTQVNAGWLVPTPVNRVKRELEQARLLTLDLQRRPG